MGWTGGCRGRTFIPEPQLAKGKRQEPGRNGNIRIPAFVRSIPRREGCDPSMLHIPRGWHGTNPPKHNHKHNHEYKYTSHDILPLLQQIGGRGTTWKSHQGAAPAARGGSDARPRRCFLWAPSHTIPLYLNGRHVLDAAGSRHGLASSWAAQISPGSENPLGEGAGK